jgi:DNA-3-methyladenine glycosylase II
MPPLTPEIYLEAVKHLSASDADLARLCDAHGVPEMRTREAGFAALLRVIVEQQLSVASARAIWGRLETAMGAPTPAALLALDDKALKACGLSGAKMRYARGLAGDITSGRVDLAGLDAMDDEAAIAELMKLKGIGRWTAEIYLLASLGRPDVFPVDDLAVAAAASHLKGRRTRFSRKHLLRVCDAWRPWRSVAARLLWHYFRSAMMGPGRPRVGPPRKRQRVKPAAAKKAAARASPRKTGGRKKPRQARRRPAR